jgi:CRP-like cAMP-binding protein
MRAEDRRVGRLERLLHLRRVPVLGTLPPDELGLVAEQGRSHSFRRGEVLLRRGDPISAVFVILEGRVRLRRGDSELGYATAGSGVGGLGFLARDEEGIDAVAETDTLAMELDTDTLVEILEDRFGVLRHLLRETSRQLINLWRVAPRECVRSAPIPLAVPAFGRGLDLVERMLFLRQALPFLRSSAAALADLARNLVEVEFGAGVVLWPRGEPARQVLMVVGGEVGCTADIPDFELRPGPGFPLGGLEAVAGGPRWYEATCRHRVVALSGDVEMLYDIFEDSAEIALDYLAQIAQHQLRALELIAQGDRRSLLVPYFGGEVSSGQDRERPARP